MPVMRTHVALLRGVNVGKHNRIAMADLREIATALGLADVTTYVQSGNVVFTASGTDTATLASDLERGIAEHSGVRPDVVVLSRDELVRVVADNPFPEETNPKCLHVVFHRGDPGPDAAAKVAAAEQRARDKGSRDAGTVVGRNIYLHTPDGLGRSELAAQLNRPRSSGNARTAPAVSTTRNWTTVTNLVTLLSG